MELQRRDILHRFIQDTGARPDSAQDILDRCNWDYRRALEMFSPSHHQPSSGSSNYGYPPTATIRHVPIVYVGSANQTQDLLPPSSGNRMNLGVGSASTGNKNNPKYATSQQQNHIGNPSQPSAKIKSIGDYGGSHYGSYGVNRSSPNNSDIHIRSYSAQPPHLNQSGYSNTQTTKPMGQNITSSTGPIVSMRPVHVTTQGPHTVTTPTATRPTPSHQPPQQVPFGNTGWPVSTSTSVGPGQNQVRSVSKVSPSHNPGVHIQDLRAPRVDLPVSVEVPITHLKSESRVSQQPITGATLVTVAPVEAQASQTLQSARSPTDLREGSIGPPLPYNSVSSQKAPLVRSNATEVGDEGRVLKRGISKTSDNVSLVDRARDVVLHDIRESAEDHVQYFVDTPELTFILPDLTVYSEDFRGFLEKDLIETATLISLEQAGCLNWWAEVGVCQRLHPMATTGDGNCLLHAASLAMWGFHDRDLILRKALYNSMTSGAFHGALFRQWRYQQTQVNKQTGLIYSEKEWKEEWENLLRLASTEPRRTNTDRGRDNSCCESPVTQGASSRHSTVVYESLEEFHVFVLAHVLRRPIVVVADKVLRDTNGEALAPIPFGGIYLPTGCLPQNCHRTPLLLTYDAAHFSALVPMKSERSPDDLPHLPVAMPILDPNYDLLPLHFAVEPGEHFDWSSLEGDDVPSTHLTIRQKLDLIEKYMNLVKLPFTRLEGDHDSDQRSNGSVDSDESAGSGCKEKRKDKKLQQQMHSVSKQFGSLGRSMGKKIKKNFNIGKSKGKINFDKENTGSKNPTIATGVTQSTKLTASIPIMFDQEQVILCAQLSAHRSEMHEQLVNNYLTEAKKRFEADRDLKRQKGVELRSRIPQKETFNKDLDKVPVKCVTPGCSMYGTASCSYLCSDCFVRSKKQALEQVPSSDRPFAYNTYPGPRSQTAIPFSSDHMYKMECGKSKFYAPVAAEENVELRNPDKKSLQPAISNVLSARPASAGAAETRSVAAGNTTIRKPLGTANHVNLIDDSLMTDTRRQTRTPSPVCHYDNVEYNDKKQQNAITASDTTDHKQCRSPLCTFYGSEATNYYCSKCFKEQQRAPLVQPEIPQTRL